MAIQYFIVLHCLRDDFNCIENTDKPTHFPNITEQVAFKRKTAELISGQKIESQNYSDPLHEPRFYKLPLKWCNYYCTFNLLNKTRATVSMNGSTINDYY